jgi:hypothetical protein
MDSGADWIDGKQGDEHGALHACLLVPLRCEAVWPADVRSFSGARKAKGRSVAAAPLH